MSNINVTGNVTARAYAKALFGKGRSESDLVKYNNVLSTLSQAVVDENFKLLISNKSVDRKQVMSIVEELIKNQLDEILTRFFSLLVQNGILNLVSNIKQEFKALLDEHNQELCVIAEYASMPDQNVQKEHKVFLNGKFNKQINTNIIINPDILAGVKFTIGDLVIDASLRSRIDQLAASLTV